MANSLDLLAGTDTSDLKRNPLDLLADQDVEKPSILSDVLRAVPSGIRTAAEGIAGSVGDLSKMAVDATSYGASALGASPETQAVIEKYGRYMSPTALFPTSEEVRNVGDQAFGGQAYQPQTVPGQYAKTATEFAPAALGGEGGVTARIARALIPAATSETAGQVSKGTAAEPYARIAGALAGGMVPTGLAKAISPMTIAPERQAAADVLRQAGVEPTAGQLTGSKALQLAEGELGGGRTQNIMGTQAEAFTDAAMQKAGASGRATPDNLAALNDQLGQGFKGISARNTMQADAPFLKDFLGTLNEYNRVLPSEQKQIIGNIAVDIGQKIKANGGSLSGEDYQTFRSRLSKRANNARGSDNELADAYRGLRNALDGAMERSINPADSGEWAQLRKQYGNAKTLERAAVGGGEDAGLGLISPARLRSAAAIGNRSSYARGEGDFSDLAHAGQALLTPLANSNTAARTAVRNVGVPFATSGVGGALAGLPGAAIGALAPYAVGRALMSRPVQAYLTNQLASGAVKTPTAKDLIVQALLASSDQRVLPPSGR